MPRPQPPRRCSRPLVLPAAMLEKRARDGRWWACRRPIHMSHKRPERNSSAAYCAVAHICGQCWNALCIFRWPDCATPSRRPGLINHPSSWRLRQSYRGGRWSSCADHARARPSSGGDHGGTGSSGGGQGPRGAWSSGRSRFSGATQREHRQLSKAHSRQPGRMTHKARGSPRPRCPTPGAPPPARPPNAAAGNGRRRGGC